VLNNKPMQMAWARENDLVAAAEPRWGVRFRKGVVPWPVRVNEPWRNEILAAQIKQYRPDVLVNHSIEVSADLLREVRPYVRLMVGCHASPINGELDLSVYDLILSAVDNFVDLFRREGLKSERFRFGFDERVLKGLDESTSDIPVSFVGNLFPVHASRIRWLEHLCEHVPVDVWAPSLTACAEDSPIVPRHRGAAWGKHMYQILHDSRVTLNHHIDVAEGYAGNVRLFEGTGVGSLLITDWKKNLDEIFDVGREVVAYRSFEECAELVRYYLEHEDERKSIARAGQQRTLKDHTYLTRMQELVDIAQRHLLEPAVRRRA
jgi:spore maturation protein CgeB